MALKSKQLSLKRSRGQKRGRRRITFTKLWRFMAIFWHSFMKTLLTLPPKMRAIVISVLFLLLWLGINWGYQALNKPSEILFPLEHSLNKRPIETWKQYESLFRQHATLVITPEFLAALAQVEAAGNPVARTYWRWQLTWNPLDWYRPASSAVGMFQITDGTFREAKRYCIHEHTVVEDGPWHDLQSCWFNSLYTRVIPSHAIELTAALLHRKVTQIIKTQQLSKVTLQKKHDLAAVIHLCGFGAGRAYAARGFRLISNQHCGDHNVSRYLKRINALKQGFIKPAGRNKTIRQAR